MAPAVNNKATDPKVILMKSYRFRRVSGWAAASLVLGATVGFTSLHMRLVKSAPAKDEIVHVAPDVIQLWFSQPPEVALTKVRLAGPGGASFNVDQAQVTDDAKSVTLAIVDSLPPGAYTVRWQTSAPDGHKVSGEYPFTYSTTESPAGDQGESDR